jgi:hypothetical protein
MTLKPRFKMAGSLLKLMNKGKENRLSEALQQLFYK